MVVLQNPGQETTLKLEECVLYTTVNEIVKDSLRLDTGGIRAACVCP
jgi:hypothetical protein